MTTPVHGPGFDAPEHRAETAPIDRPGSLALTFAGQGAPWWPTLCRLHHERPRLRPLIGELADGLAAAAEDPAVRDSGCLPNGLDLRAWLDSDLAGDGPPREVLRSAVVAAPAIVATQVVLHEALLADGLAAAYGRGDVLALAGHSQGLVTAMAISEQPGRLTAPERIVDHLRVVLEAAVAARRSCAPASTVDTDGAGWMAAVTGIDSTRLASQIEELNLQLDRAASLASAVIGGPDRVVVSGPPRSLVALHAHLERLVAAEADLRRRRRLGGRPLAMDWEWLDVDLPFHHPALTAAAEATVARLRALGVSLPAARREIPVYLGAAWVGGDDPNHDALDAVVHAVLTEPCNWPATLAAASRGVGAVIDVGPGDGIARLSRGLLAGRGVPVVAAGTEEGRRSLFTLGADLPDPGPRYEDFAPKLAEVEGRILLDNRYTRAVGRSPIILAGMTPTTVDAGIVAAAANAGFTAELAGGGQVTEEMFEERMAELMELLEPGAGFTFNALFLDPYLWNLHLGGRRLVQRARARGIPIEGVTVSAGIPAQEEAVALLRELHRLGMHHCAFKPGTVEGIGSVLRIARDVPHLDVFVHIEGGRAGGHHSWEDLDDLLWATYRELRAVPNVIVCVGGGIGTPEVAARYLDGSWALDRGGSRMPVDAVLIGTAAMACAEATATPTVKAALAAAPGGDRWVFHEPNPTGVVSGRSQLDADLHQLDGAAARCGRLLDEVAGDAEAIERRRDEVIAALDATAKPYFGDLAAMTYLDVLRRYVQLAAIGRHGRYEDGVWLDPSWRGRFIALLQRTEARLGPVDEGLVPTSFGTPDTVDDPEKALDRLLTEVPQAATTVLHPGDVAEVLRIFRSPGKPVPFVPIVDADVRRWWRSDSLWQAQHPAYDAEQVIVIPGPTAVAGIVTVDEPVAELLARFETAAVQRLLADGVTPRRRPARRGADDLVDRALRAPGLWVDGRLEPSPIRLLGRPADWRREPDGRAVLHHGSEAAELVPVGPAALTLTITWPATDGSVEHLAVDLSATVRNGVEAFEADPRTYGRALGGLLTVRPAGRWMGERARSHGRLVGGPGTPVPDALMAHVWPSVFDTLAEERLGAALLRLVHLGHRLDRRSLEPLEEGAELEGTTTVIDRSDTPDGHRITTRTALATFDGTADGMVIAVVTSTFLLRGVATTEPAGPTDSASSGTRRASDSRPDFAPTPPRTMARVIRRSPSDLHAFAALTGDHNPIHRSRLVARLAGLDDVIVHGMWSSAAAQAVVVDEVAAGRADRLVGWSIEFMAPLPRDTDVAVSVTRTGLVDGRVVVRVDLTIDGADGPTTVAVARAEVAPPRTMYVFPGQGIQHRGMGMDGYGRSRAARSVWDRADAHTRTLGFSILDIVRRNPTEVEVAGEAHRHPAGVLHLTQFTQVAMATLAQAQMAELRELGVIDAEAVCAGHSVGEYNAVAAVAGALPLETLIEIVYRRGLAMHHLIDRDERGESGYRLAVIRPHEAAMTHEDAETLVAEVAARTGEACEIVNHNLRGKQYAVAATTGSLAVLEEELERRRRPGGRAPLLLVPGIDVPFHSVVLRSGVAPFRDALDAILPDRIDATRLVGRYIPNLVPRLFSLDQEFVAEVADYVPSEPLRAVLADWDSASADAGHLCRTLLVELLAWQFASPVRWIETMDLMFTPEWLGGLGIERVVEVGVGVQPTLANLARATLALPDRTPATAAVTVWNAEAEFELVSAQDTDPEAEPDIVGAPEAPRAPEAPPEPPAAPVAAAPPPADQPVDVATALRTMLALAARVRPDQLANHDTIDELFGGVSSRRNQALMDLGREFGVSGVDGAHELPLDGLAEELAARTRYRHPGPYLRDARDQALVRLLGPAGRKARDVAGRITGHWGLGDGWVDRTLLDLVLAHREGDSTRGGALGSGSAPTDAASVDVAVDEAVTRVAADLGMAVAPIAAAGGGGAVDGTALAEVREELMGTDGVLARSARFLLESIGAPVEPADTERAGRTDEEGTVGSTPDSPARAFDPDRHVVLDDAWAHARDELARLVHDVLDHRVGVEAATESAARLSAFGTDPAIAAHLGWYRRRARELERPDLTALLDRLDGRPQPVPVPSVAPTLTFEDGRPVAVEEATGGERLASLLESTVAANDPKLRPHLDAAWRRLLEEPVDLGDEVALVTGAAPGSIGEAAVRRLLAGGATVVVTASRLDAPRRRELRRWYRGSAAPGAELHAVPANLASFEDVDALVDWLVAPTTTTIGGTPVEVKRSLIPTLVLPFAAPPVSGTVADVGPGTEAAMRVLLWGVERLIGAIAAHRERTGMDRRCRVVLPLSPNHGTFGGDGAYAEAKAALETLLAKWTSEREAWGGGVRLIGASIGWVRGTNLMGPHDVLAGLVEERLGVRTHSAAEMAWLLVGLALVEGATEDPIRVELGGGLAGRSIGGDLRDLAAEVRARAALLTEVGEAGSDPARTATIAALPSHTMPMAAPIEASIEHGLAPRDLVVIVSGGELGPFGTARTRSEVEVEGTFSAAGVAELAWLCGLVRWDAKRDGGTWVDSATDETVAESDLAGRYREEVRERTGLRFVPDDGVIVDGTAPVLQRVFVERDLTFTVGSEEEARWFLSSAPEQTRIGPDRNGGWWVTRAAGSEIRLPGRVPMTRRVGGALPTGFDPAVAGVPTEMSGLTDRVALWNLVATADAFLAAGLDPEELLEHLHPTRIGNTQGTGMGGMGSLRRMYVDRLLGEEVPNDTLQEALANVAVAYVMQSFVGGYGPMVHPVAACATAAVSLEEAVDKIRAGRCEVVVAGGWDDLSAEGMTGFGAMSATAATDTMLNLGLEPHEHSRPNDRRRRGFVEAQGGGTFLVMRGDVALELGLPVAAVVADVGSHADGIHTSVPAPGIGALGAACGGIDSRLGEALTRHGLRADDIAVVSKHDTSTTANDPNESELHERLADALGRDPGNPLRVISQKSLTGHAKGGAAAWQVNGVCRLFETGVVPGNANLECVDPVLRRFARLTWSDRPLRPAASERPRAALVTSLGFGHVNCVVLLAAPEVFLAAVPPEQRADYAARAARRRAEGTRRRLAAMVGGPAWFTRRTDRRTGEGLEAERRETEAAFLVDPSARVVGR